VSNIGDSTFIDGTNDVDAGFVLGDYYISLLVLFMIRRHFNKFDVHKRSPALRDIIWEEDKASGGVDKADRIRIDLYSENNYSRINTSPNIIVKENACGSVKLGIRDEHMHVTSFTNVHSYSRAWAGSLTIFCNAKHPALSRMLAWEVATLLEESAVHIRKKTNVKMEVARVKPVKPLRELPPYLSTPVLIEYTFVRSWQVTPAAPLLQRIVPNSTVK
jgi:hypothetical protein